MECSLHSQIATHGHILGQLVSCGAEGYDGLSLTVWARGIHQAVDCQNVLHLDEHWHKAVEMHYGSVATKYSTHLGEGAMRLFRGSSVAENSADPCSQLRSKTGPCSQTSSLLCSVL